METDEFNKPLDEMAEQLFKAYDDKITALENVGGLSIKRIKDALFAISSKITQFQLTVKAAGLSKINERGFKLTYDKILRELKEIR